MYRENWLERLEKRYKWIGFTLLLDLIDGLSLTLSYLFSKTITMQYPDREKWVPYPRFRGHHFLRKYENGETRCVACELCAKICPCQCIRVVPYEDENGNRRPLIYDLNTARCLFCGLCEDACPVEAIALGQHYEFSAYDSKRLLVGKEELMEMPGKTEEGGKVVRARLVTGDKVFARTEGREGYHWWNRIRRK